VDLVNEYWLDVFEPFLARLESGLTPNPDLPCNVHIKFGPMWEYAQQRLGADLLATGHYARLVDAGAAALDAGDVQLARAADETKDQSYFLATVSGPPARGKRLRRRANASLCPGAAADLEKRAVPARQHAQRAGAPACGEPRPARRLQEEQHGPLLCGQAALWGFHRAVSGRPARGDSLRRRRTRALANCTRPRQRDVRFLNRAPLRSALESTEACGATRWAKGRGLGAARRSISSHAKTWSAAPW